MEPRHQAQAIRLAISSAHAVLTFCLLVISVGVLSAEQLNRRLHSCSSHALAIFPTLKSCQSLICSSWQFYHFRRLYECKWPACVDDWANKVTSTKSQSIMLKLVLWTSVSLGEWRQEGPQSLMASSFNHWWGLGAVRDTVSGNNGE